jgi:hypothetical protein
MEFAGLGRHGRFVDFLVETTGACSEAAEVLAAERG